jgi:hypothetical protein
VKPVIFLLGPSGVGKTFVSTGLEEDYSFRHFVIHEKSFKANGFPAEWDKDPGQIDVANLATTVRSRLAVEQHDAILSIPTTQVFTCQQLEAASRAGVSPVVLWGTEERCLEARRVLQTARIGWFDEHDYRRKNRRTFETYARSEYDDFRVAAFRSDGSRWPRERILAPIMERTAGR